jgi:hypothetical protein
MAALTKPPDAYNGSFYLYQRHLGDTKSPEKVKFTTNANNPYAGKPSTWDKWPNGPIRDATGMTGASFLYISNQNQIVKAFDFHFLQSNPTKTKNEGAYWDFTDYELSVGYDGLLGNILTHPGSSAAYGIPSYDATFYERLFSNIDTIDQLASETADGSYTEEWLSWHQAPADGTRPQPSIANIEYREAVGVFYLIYLIRKILPGLNKDPSSGKAMIGRDSDSWRNPQNTADVGVALSRAEVDYLFLNAELLGNAYLLASSGALPFDTYSGFLTYLLRYFPTLWTILPGYDSHIAPGGLFSFDQFSTDSLEEVKRYLQTESWIYPGPIEELLLITFDEMSDPLYVTHPTTGVPAVKTACAAASPGGGGGPDGYGGGTGRYEEVVFKKKMTLPPPDPVGTATRADWVNKVLTGTLSGISGLAQLQFEEIDVNGKYRTIPGNLITDPANYGTWFLDTALQSIVRSIYGPDPSNGITLQDLVLKSYIGFITSVVDDAQDVMLFKNESTLRQKYDKAMSKGVPLTGNLENGNLIDAALFLILLNHEMLLRASIWQTAKQNLSATTGDKFNASDEYKKIEAQNLKNKSVTNPPPFNPATLDPLGAEKQQQILGRQRFFKQCALLLNAGVLKQVFTKKIKDRLLASNGGSTFNSRVTMLQTKSDQDRLINDLTTGQAVANFFDLSPAEVSSLVPRVRLYRVRNKAQGKLEQTEFILPATTDVNRENGYLDQPTKFCDNPFDKGEGMGLKSFSFSFNGTNPAESRNDIEAKLSLFFQSFQDLLKDRISSNGKIYKFVDLIIQPDFNNKADKPIHTDQYDPAYYRIRVDVGYVPESAPDRLQTAISLTNTSYYLNMVDHDIQIANDGSVTVNINYRAYVESALKSTKYDALATPAIIERRNANLKQLLYLLSQNKCSAQQIQDLKIAMSAQIANLRRSSLSSILTRLEKSKRIYACQVSQDAARDFRRRGYFGTDNPPSLVNMNDSTEAITPGDKLVASIDAGAFEKLLDGDVDKSNYEDPTDTMIQFFYFADLLEIVMDSLYDAGGTEPVEGMENFTFILGSFEFNPYVTGNNNKLVLNIGEIPISTDYFTTWFIDNIVSQGRTRDSFPIMYFVRNLANNLLSDSLLSTCINRNIKKNLIFKTTSLPAYSKTQSHPFAQLTYYPKDNVEDQETFVLNTDDFRGSLLPLTRNKTDDINNYYNYAVLHTEGSSLTKSGRGKYSDDIIAGRFHVGIGSDRGIVKSISFKKSDMQYTREARFQSNGIDGLLQLSAVYVATIEMYGNTIFYPGMEVYINPYGIGGTTLGAPQRSNSLANKLGFGGYHTIISVNTQLKAGSYSTTIEAQWYFSGAAKEDTMDQQGYVRQKVDYDSSASDVCDSAIIDAETDMMRLAEDPTSISMINAPEPVISPSQAKTSRTSSKEKRWDAGKPTTPPSLGVSEACPEPPKKTKENKKIDFIEEDTEVEVVKEATTIDEAVDSTADDAGSLGTDQAITSSHKLHNITFGDKGLCVDQPNYKESGGQTTMQYHDIVPPKGVHDGDKRTFTFVQYRNGVTIKVAEYVEFDDGSERRNYADTYNMDGSSSGRVFYCKPGEGATVTNQEYFSTGKHYDEEVVEVDSSIINTDSYGRQPNSIEHPVYDAQRPESKFTGDFQLPNGSEAGLHPGVQRVIDTGERFTEAMLGLIDDAAIASQQTQTPPTVDDDVLEELADDGPLFSDEEWDEEDEWLDAITSQGRSPIGGMTTAGEEKILTVSNREDLIGGDGYVDDFYGMSGRLEYDYGDQLFRFYTGKIYTHPKTEKSWEEYLLFPRAEPSFFGDPGPKNWNEIVQYYNDKIGFYQVEELEAARNSLAGEEESQKLKLRSIN